MAVQHIEVALVDRQIDRLADRATRVVQRVRHVGELHEVLEVVDTGVAATLVEVAHEGRSVGRREHRGIAADPQVAGGVARDLGELPRRVLLDERATHARRETHAFAVDLCACLAEDVEDLGVLAELDAGLLEDAVRVLLDDRQAFLAQHLVAWDLADDVRRGGCASGRTGGALGVAGVRAARAR